MCNYEQHTYRIPTLPVNTTYNNEHIQMCFQRFYLFPSDITLTIQSTFSTKHTKATFKSNLQIIHWNRIGNINSVHVPGDDDEVTLGLLTEKHVLAGSILD